MKNSDLLLAGNTLWVAHHGGTHGSPMSPLLQRGVRATHREAATGGARLRRPFGTHRDGDQVAP
jgi:hypothetical protein